MGLTAAATLFLVKEEGAGSERIATHGLAGRLLDTMADHRSIYLRAAGPMIALTVLRQARQIFLPLWGDHIGLDIAQIGLLTSISFALDAAVFYPSGLLMDRKGRKWTGVPCLLTIAVGMLILPLSHDFLSFMAVAMLTGLGNGMGAGINQTLGADFAPPDRRGEFLGVWRLLGDVGQAGGPFAIGILTGVASLAVASVASAGIGVLGAIGMLILIPETLKQHRAKIAARAGPAVAVIEVPPNDRS